MSNIWPSSDLFELMEGLKIIERVRGEYFRLRPKFIDFLKDLDYQMGLRVVAGMISECGIPEPVTKEVHRTFLFKVVMTLWDSSLTEDEHEAAAIFLSAISWDFDWVLLPVLKKGGIK